MPNCPCHIIEVVVEHRPLSMKLGLQVNSPAAGGFTCTRFECLSGVQALIH